MTVLLPDVNIDTEKCSIYFFPGTVR
jgi:hypothetical protein